MMKAIVAVIAGAFLCTVANARVVTSASCVRDSIEVVVHIDYAAYYGVVGMNLEWSMIGDCGPRVAVAAPAVPVAATDDDQVLVVRVPVPVRDRILRFYTVFTDVNGNRVAGADAGCSWFSDYAACGEGMAFRARLFDWGFGLIVDFCDDQCWLLCSSSGLDLWRVESTWRSFVNTGRLVNVYGEPGMAEHPPCGMPGVPCLSVTRLEFEDDPAGCSAVKEEASSWGALKSQYR